MCLSNLIINTYNTKSLFNHFKPRLNKLKENLISTLVLTLGADLRSQNKDVHLQQVSKDKWFSYMKTKSQERLLRNSAVNKLSTISLTHKHRIIILSTVYPYTKQKTRSVSGFFKWRPGESNSCPKATPHKLLRV
ncbi:hypothetical protein D3C77_324340 [compost metagenome]